MLKNWSPQNKSFAVLFGIAVVGTYLTIVLSNNLSNISITGLQPGGYVVTFYHPQSGHKPTSVQAASPKNKTANNDLPDINPVSTTGWKTYQDSSYRFSFQYPSGWQVKQPKQITDGYYTLQIDPGKKFYDMKVYVGQAGFYASMDALPHVTASIGGQSAIDVCNLLYGVKANGFYYTFDNGLSTELIDEFNALIKTVKFQ